MEALSRQEYPAILDRLPPSVAAAKLNERVKKIERVNIEVANWLQERRKVEQVYVLGLRKLAQKQLQDVGGDLGVFDGPWRKIVHSMEEISRSHALLVERIEKDVEQPLRSFATSNREMQGMATIQGNLNAMAKEVEEAQHNNDKISRKGGKASSHKVEIALSKLQTANQQWDAQAPFVFENLQSLDERRLNHLRDVLTQFGTLEADLVESNRVTVEQTITTLLEVDTTQEIRSWSQSAIAGKPLLADRKARQPSIAGTTSGSVHTEASVPPPPPAPRSTTERSTTDRSITDNRSEHSTKQESLKPESTGESKLKSRFGTMLGRRRQSIHGTFSREKSPSKGFMPMSLPFASSRSSASREGRPSPSPRSSSNNLRETPVPDNRLSSLSESPPSVSPRQRTNGTNGINSASAMGHDGAPSGEIPNGPNGTSDPHDLSDVQPPPGPPPSHLKPSNEMQKDSEGFNVPAPLNDPISQAQNEAALDSDQPQFKLDIRKEPIQEQDADAQAALSNVANTLRSNQLVTPGRKVGTVRGRRDVRNTIYVPLPESSLTVATSDSYLPPSPGINTGRAAALAALSSAENAPPSASDTTSIRSGHSLTNTAVVKHPEMHQVGLNASIIETFNVSFENGATQVVKITGEIALNQNKGDDDFSALNDQKIRINNFAKLETIGPNRTFIHAASPDKPEEFTVDLSHVHSKPAVAFTYRVHIDDSTAKMEGPLLLKPAWKPQGDKLGLLVEYSLNPAWGTEPVSFTNLVLVATYQGARATGCQTKPTGTHLKEKSLVYWRLGDVNIGPETHKVICRFVGAEGAMPEPGHIDARWEIHAGGPLPSQGSGIFLSRLEVSKGKEKEESCDPFADDSIANFMAPPGVDKWTEIETSRKFVSGKYEAR